MSHISITGFGETSTNRHNGVMSKLKFFRNPAFYNIPPKSQKQPLLFVSEQSYFSSDRRELVVDSRTKMPAIERCPLGETYNNYFTVNISR